jgi:hypothetical protein
VDGFIAFMWIDRTLRAFGLGLDRVMCQPLTQVGYARAAIPEPVLK